MVVRLIVALAGLLLSPSLLLAQAGGEGPGAKLRPGVLVRMHVPLVQAKPIVGSFVGLSPDTLSVEVRTGASTSLRHIPYRSIEHLEVAVGRERLWSGALGAAAGALVLGGLTALDQRDARDGCRPECQVLDLELGIRAVVGAAVGAGLGAVAFAPRRWDLLIGGGER